MPSVHGEDGLVRPSGYRGALFVLSASLMMGACAQMPDAPLPILGQSAEHAAHQEPEQAQPRAELDKAVVYWGQQYAKTPRDKKAALGYALNLKAAGQKQKALGVLQQASLYHGADRELASEYGRLALEFGQVGLARKLLAVADDPSNPDWRVISAQGTVLAKQGDYKGAIPYYERALQLAPDQPSVVNNLAMALAADGQPAKAEPLLRQAVASRNADPKVRQNLVLVLGLQGKYDEAKHAGLAADDAAADVDYLRRMVRLEPKSPSTSVADARPESPALRPASREPANEGDAADGWTTRVANAAPALALKPSKH
ncbi:MAG: tetratricopeptide repeat protein [Hyphomicrobiaceae bacterium]|nr:tetratricopeptide repeat protein [Hyphomicrobiaceae bacterium]